MADPVRAARRRGGIEAVRNRLVAALHSGLLRPGGRAPSVRRLAELLDLDRKTIHRAYRELASEGLVEIRAGSGTFVADVRPALVGQPSATLLVAAAQRCRAEAAALGLPPAVFARFLEIHFGNGLSGIPLAVAECNREQVGVFAQELREHLGVRPRPVLLDDLHADVRKALGGTRAIVSTDFHYAEIVERVRDLGSIIVYRVSLEPAVPRLLVEHARRGPTIMVVVDRSFAPGFVRFLHGLGIPTEVVARIRIVEPREARALFRTAREGSVYVSPLVAKAMDGAIPERFQRVRVGRHLATASVERLRARIAFDVAQGALRTS